MNEAFMSVVCYVMGGKKPVDYIAEIDTTTQLLFLQRVFFIAWLSSAEWLASSFAVQQCYHPIYSKHSSDINTLCIKEDNGKLVYILNVVHIH